MKYHFLLLLIPLFLTGCGTTDYSSLRDDFYAGNYDSASSGFRSLYEDSDDKDRLLYLMEAGIVFHTKGDFETSNKVFLDANDVAETIRKSITGQTAAFLLNDNETNFRGESYERILIKFYIALNHLMMGEYEKAKVWFRKLDLEHREMKWMEAVYRQNLMARYLDAIISESRDSFNDARVQYKNIEMISENTIPVIGDRYVLAVKEGDRGDMARYSSGQRQVLAYNTSLTPIPYNPKLAEVVVINQGGKAAIKVSRGKIKDDRALYIALVASIHAAIRSGSYAISATTVLLGIANAENPVPKYEYQDKFGMGPLMVRANQRDLGKTVMYNDYSNTAMANFNDQHDRIVATNAASIATKFVAATVAAHASSQMVKSQTRALGGIAGPLAGLAAEAAIGAGAGVGVMVSIEPDLRSWSLLPSNFQARRFFLEPGEYHFQFAIPGLPGQYSSDVTVNARSGKPIFINIRSIKNRVFVTKSGEIPSE